MLQQEMDRAGAYNPMMGMGTSMFGPTLLEYGTEDQKQRHIPSIVKGERGSLETSQLASLAPVEVQRRPTVSGAPASCTSSVRPLTVIVTSFASPNGVKRTTSANLATVPMGPTVGVTEWACGGADRTISTTDEINCAVARVDATGYDHDAAVGVLDAINVDTIASTGYSFQVELAWRTYKNGFRMTEVPITFTEREHGVSKMSGNIFKEQLLRVTVWGVQARKQTLLSRLGRKPRQGATWP